MNRRWGTFADGTRVCLNEVVAFEPNGDASTMVHLSSGRSLYVPVSADEFQTEMETLLPTSVGYDFGGADSE